MALLINLRTLRKEKNLTQEEFAELLGVGQSYVSGIENNKLMPSLPMAAKIAETLGVTLDTLMAEGQGETVDA